MRFHHWLAGAVVMLVPCIASVCHAESAPHMHDGFYLQMSLGAGYLHTSADEGADSFSIYGGAVTSSLWIGGSLMPGLALGGGTLSAFALSPGYKETINGQSISGTTGTSTSLQLNMLGLVSDFYPDPTQGLHFQAMIGYAVLSASQNGSSSGNDPTGLGLMGGVGYDFWVSDEWSIGVLGRFAYAATKYSAGGVSVSYPTIVPDIAASFTYN